MNQKSSTRSTYRLFSIILLVILVLTIDAHKASLARAQVLNTFSLKASDLSSNPKVTPVGGIIGANCSSPVVLDDQWSSGFRLVCQNNFYVLMVDLTNPAIKVEVVAANSGIRTVSSFADSNTIAIINADYQYTPCASGAICSQGLTISNGSNPTTYTNISHLCSDAKVRREIGFSQDGRVVVDWWYRFVSDSQARSWCGSIPGSGGGLEQYSHNLVGGGPQFTFDGTFHWDCQYGQDSTTHNCLSSGGDVGINGEHFGVGDWWNRYQSAIGYTTDGTILVLGESNNQTHSMQSVHDIMYQRLNAYGRTLKNAFKFDAGSKAGFWYYNHTYDSTPGVTVPNVIRVQRTNSTCYALSTNVNPGGSGNISVNTPSNCTQGKYTPGTNVQLNASPNGGYSFSNWSGDASGTSSSTTIIMNSNKTVTANFKTSGGTPLLTLNLGSTLRNRSVTIELRYPLLPHLTTPFIWSTTSDANGNIIDFPLIGASPGTTYNLLVKPQGWLRRLQEVTLVSGTNSVNFQSSFTNSAGDINEDNRVDILDFQLLSNDFGTTNTRSDLNGDNRVDILDFQLLSNSFGRVGDAMVIAGAFAESITANSPADQFSHVSSNDISLGSAAQSVIGTWNTTGSMASPRWYQTATLLTNGKVLLTGGYNNSALASAELYNPSTGAWTVTGSMATPRFAHSATLLPSGKVLVVGGLNSSWTALATAELYDPATGLWTTTPSMGQARYSHTATLLSNGKVLVAGGSGSTGVGPLASAELYDPSSNMWTSAGQMSIARASQTATQLSNGRILVTGGLATVSLASAELYNPTTGNWTVTGSMSNARVGHTAALLSNGKVLVVGGRSNSTLSSAELYDPSSSAWAATGSLVAGREHHAATLLPNGKVLTSGGNNNLGAYLSSVEVYNPGNGMWTPSTSLTTARSDHSTLLLRNCRVLTVGGKSASGILASAEIYAPPKVDIFIGGAQQACYFASPHESVRVSYAGVNNGPVKVISSNGVPIVASERVAYFNGSAWTSHSELMGLPANQLTNSYMFPWYNNVDLNAQLRFGNVGTANTTVTVTIGGVVRGTYNLGPNQSTRVSYPGLDSGPVKVSSSGGVPIITSLRVAYHNGSAWTSFSEMMGLPANKLSNGYLFPWYNNLDLNSQLRFGNVGTADTTVTITIGGVVRGSYDLSPNQSQRVSYSGLDSGPVKLTSSGNIPIIASLRVAYHNGSAWTDFSEMMGLPANSVSTHYSFPIYNNADLNTQLRFANVGNANTTVTVTINGVVKGTYNLAPNQSQRVSYAGVNSGPVVIQSSGGAPIIASERIAYFNGSVWTSFGEMMGLPQAQLWTSYIFPWYNNVDLNTQLRFGVP